MKNAVKISPSATGKDHRLSRDFPEGCRIIEREQKNTKWNRLIFLSILIQNGAKVNNIPENKRLTKLLNLRSEVIPHGWRY